MHRHLLLSALILTPAWMLSGCSSTPPVHADPYSVTMEHDKDEFREAMDKAKEHCRSQGKTVEHKVSNCLSGSNCVSTFVCTSHTP